MIIKIPQITLRVRIEPFFQKLRYHSPLDFQGAGGNIHHPVQPSVKIILIRGQIRQTRHIDRYYAYASGAFAGTEEASRLFSQFSQIQPQSAAHAAHIPWFHIRINIVGKIWSSVFCCHFKQQPVVFVVRPVKIPGNGIGRNRILKSPSIGVPVYHRFDKRLIYHIHFFFTVFIFKIHLPAAHDRRQFRQIIRHGPIQGNIGKRSLCPPPAGRIHAINKRFNTFFHFRVSQAIHLNKRSQIGVKRRKCLCARPFILHNPKKVYHLIA